MSEPITVTATVAVWLASFKKPHQLVDAMNAGNSREVIHMLTFYGDPERDAFSTFTRVGEADVTVRLIPQDEQVRLAVQSLQAELEKARAEWLQTQRKYLDEISKLQAISYEAPAAVEAA